MAQDTRPGVAPFPADGTDYRDNFTPNWSERLIVAVAVGLAIFIVASIAALMGMA